MIYDVKITLIFMYENADILFPLSMFICNMKIPEGVGVGAEGRKKERGRGIFL